LENVEEKLKIKKKSATCRLFFSHGRGFHFVGRGLPPAASGNVVGSKPPPRHGGFDKKEVRQRRTSKKYS